MNEIGIYIFVFAASAFVGGFLNVVIHRGPALWRLIDAPGGDRGNFIKPRSYCPQCRTAIPYLSLIPVLSYLLLRGRCGACAGRIPLRYPLVELAAAFHGVACVMLFGLSAAAAFAALFGWILIALTVIDFETGYLPDWLTGTLALAGLCANAFSTFATPLDSIIGALAGLIVFWAIGAAWRQWRGVDALGLGDAKLLGALGAWMGWDALPLIVLAGSLASLTIVFLPVLRGRPIATSEPIPFGPGLAFGGYLVFVSERLLT